MSPSRTNAPRGLRVSERLLRDYRELQGRYGAQHLDEHGLHPVAERLERRILKACELYPWTPPAVFFWTCAWLHALAYGAEAKTRKRFQPWYGAMPRKRGLCPAWNGCAWVLKFPDLDKFAEQHLDDDERRRHRAV